MPPGTTFFADLSLWPYFHGAGPLASLLIVAGVTAVGLAAAFAATLKLSHRWAGARPVGFPDVEWVASDVVEEGMSVEIEAPTAMGMRRASSVIRAAQKRWFALSAPEPEEMGFSVGAPLEVRVRGESALYRFHATVRDRRTVQGVATLYVERPARIEKVQRRDYFRIDVRLAALLSDLRPAADPNEPIRGTIESLSGGGFRITMPPELPAGTPVRLRVADGPLAGFAFDARVVRCDRVGHFGAPRYRASCEFEYIADETRNLIVSYCYDIQREAMRAA